MNYTVCLLADLTKILAVHRDIPLISMRSCSKLLTTLVAPHDIARHSTDFLDLAFEPNLPKERLIKAHIAEIASRIHQGVPNFSIKENCLFPSYRALLESVMDGHCSDANVRRALTVVKLEAITSYIDDDVRTDAPLQLITPCGMALIDRCLETQTEESFYRIGFRPRGEGDPSIPFGEARHETFEDAISALKALFPN